MSLYDNILLSNYLGSYKGLVDCRLGAKRALSEIQVEIKRRWPKGRRGPIESQDASDYSYLMVKTAIIGNIVKEAEAEIALLGRLSNADYMRDAYNILLYSNWSDQLIVSFISAATSANRNFTKHRQIKKQSELLIADISRSALAMVAKIKDLRSMGVKLPELLEPMPDMKGGFRHRNVGAREQREMATLKQENLLKQEYERRAKGTSIFDTREDITYTLFRIERALNSWKCEFVAPEIEAGIRGRQSSRKSSYLRSFVFRLEQHGVHADPDMRKAVAITANAVFDSTDVTEDDVRKALKRAKTMGPQG